MCLLIFVVLKQTLLDLGISPNLKDVRGLTPLYYCVAHNCNEECMEMLLTERAVIGSQDEQGWFELHHVSYSINNTLIHQLSLCQLHKKSGLSNTK